MGLAAEWEACTILRNRGRLNGFITCWPTPKTTGVPSMSACALNSKLLECLATWWVQHADAPSSIPINTLRDEAHLWDKKYLNVSMDSFEKFSTRGIPTLIKQWLCIAVQGSLGL